MQIISIAATSIMVGVAVYATQNNDSGASGTATARASDVIVDEVDARQKSVATPGNDDAKRETARPDAGAAGKSLPRT